MGILSATPDDIQENYHSLVAALEIRYRSYYLKQDYQSQLKPE